VHLSHADCVGGCHVEQTAVHVNVFFPPITPLAKRPAKRSPKTGTIAALANAPSVIPAPNAPLITALASPPPIWVTNPPNTPLSFFSPSFLALSDSSPHEFVYPPSE